MTFDSIEKGQLFNGNGEYAEGMNSIALGQYVHNLSIIAFNLMVNHCHILAYGSGEDMVRFFTFMKRRIGERLKEDGFAPLPLEYGFKLVKVEDKRQLADTIIYIARNPFRACPGIAAGSYLWGSTNLIFNGMKDIVAKRQFGELSLRKKRLMLKSKRMLPDNYLFNESLGFILPESYVLTEKVERLFGSSWNYNYNVVRKIDAYVRIAEGVGETVILSEEELGEVISISVKKMFNVSSVRELGIDDRCRLAVHLKTKYRVNIKRIARRLQLDVSTLKRLFE